MVPIWDQPKCKAAYFEDTITDRMFCAGYENGGHDACIGDSGGPLIVHGKLFGIISWGTKCAEKNRPGVYTYIPSVKRWIEYVMKQTSYR